jgi:NADH-quinone oxidoreductase subunit G
LRQLEQADFILCVGVDPINEAPMLAMAMRQAQRNGARIVVLDPRPVGLPFEFQHLAAAPDDFSSLIGTLIKAAVDRSAAIRCGEKAAGLFDTLPEPDPVAGSGAQWFSAAAEDLKKSQRPVIVCGTDSVSDTEVGLTADLALLLRAADQQAGLFYLLPGANAFGAGLVSDNQESLLTIIEAIETGAVKAMILVESDPLFHFPDRSRLERALDALELLILLDCIRTDVVPKAHLFMPASALYEADGIFVNQEGRAQMVRQAYGGGVPIAQSGGGDHPPRKYGSGIPGADPRPAWQILAQLAGDKIKPEENALAATIYQWLAEAVPDLAACLASADAPDEGIRLHCGANPDLGFTSDFSGPGEASPGDLTVMVSDLTFGSEALSAHSECLRELEPEPAVIMHTDDAKPLALNDGDPVCIQTESGRLEARLKVLENMAPGVLVVPRHRKLAWQIFKPGRPSIGRDQIKKVTV